MRCIGSLSFMFDLLFVLLCFAVYAQLWVVASVTFICVGWCGILVLSALVTVVVL